MDYGAETARCVPAAFAGFDPRHVASLTPSQIDSLLVDSEIIRHRQKAEAIVSNAAALGRIQVEVGSFDDYIWDFVRGSPLINHWRVQEQVPTATALSSELSADLRRRGFRFVGPTICYSYLQAAGLVLDHVTRCFRFAELAGWPSEV
ncbi:MAG: DNA-3-methyladenine glycosylase I [Candidatus Dormiibacterota bacterium]